MPSLPVPVFLSTPIKLRGACVGVLESTFSSCRRVLLLLFSFPKVRTGFLAGVSDSTGIYFRPCF